MKFFVSNDCQNFVFQIAQIMKSKICVENLKQGDALFYAIQGEFYEAIELLLQNDPQITLQIQPGTTSPFPPGLTPIMFAAHRNNYKILAILYQ